MFGTDSSKTQKHQIPSPENLPSDVIVSPDTKRKQRVPPGQSRTLKWPVLDAFGAPSVDTAKWTLRIDGLVGSPVEFGWKEFKELPQIKVFADFHCVTRWSRLGNIWTGVSTKALIEKAGGASPEANYVVATGYDKGWTTNLPLADFMQEDALVAFLHDDEELSLEHGGPARLIVPQLYAWKSAKWLSGITLADRDRPGFWERNGYHNHGDPWKEERFGW